MKTILFIVLALAASPAVACDLTDHMDRLRAEIEIRQLCKDWNDLANPDLRSDIPLKACVENALEEMKGGEG